MTTENTTETVEATVATQVLPLNTMVQDAEEALQAVKTAQLAYEAKLQAIASDHGATFNHTGQWFQIRSRESSVEGRKITYLCELKDEPKTWLKGPKKKAVAAIAVEESLTDHTVTATVSAETTEETVTEGYSVSLDAESTTTVID